MLPLNVLILILCKILIDNVLELSKMMKRATWKKILENEEDRKKIEEIFTWINEYTKNFHVRLPFNDSMMTQMGRYYFLINFMVTDNTSF